MKKSSLAILTALSIAVGTVTAFAATSFQVTLPIKQEEITASTANKVISTDHVHLQITGGNINQGRSGYYVRSASTGALVADYTELGNTNRNSQVIPYKEEYKNASGLMNLNVRSVTGESGYTIYGEWNPNG